MIRRTNKDEEEEEEVRLLKNEKEKYLRDEDRKNQEGREKSIATPLHKPHPPYDYEPCPTHHAVAGEAVLAMEEYLGATAQFHYCPDIGEWVGVARLLAQPSFVC